MEMFFILVRELYCWLSLLKYNSFYGLHHDFNDCDRRQIFIISSIKKITKRNARMPHVIKEKREPNHVIISGLHLKYFLLKPALNNVI